MGRYRLGIDIGGTFTDFALQNCDTGELAVWKYLSSPSDPSVAAVEGAAELLVRSGVEFAEIEQIIHGTTIGGNIIVESKGARTALLVTEGFGDMLLIARQARHNPYDIVTDKHPPLVPRELVFEIPERVQFDGQVHRDADEARVREVARRLRGLEVETVAVSLLHSYVNPVHELRVAAILGEEAPEVLVSLSSDVAPVIREYERTTTTVANAYIRPAFTEYLQNMTAALEERGFNGSLYLMQANGGVASAEVTAQLPVRAIESGPAAGVTMAVALGARSGYEDLLAFDMGGTTAKACLVDRGQPRILTLFEVDRKLMRPGTGLPMLIPSVDLIEIGAGGGSIARTALGIIKVGPESAGADPGPVAYALGGTHPTVTDANVVLGYLDPSYFNGGRMGLDVAGAERAIQERIADPLEIPPEHAAWGIHDAVTTNMHHAMRAVTIDRARDPRRLMMVAFGGAGPMHAARLARQLGMRQVMLPAFAGVTSAIGLLHADPRFDLVRTWISAATNGNVSEMEELFRGLEETAQEMLDTTGLDGKRSIIRSVDMRYRGQGNVVEVPLADGTDAAGRDLATAFNDRYAGLYGYADEEAVPEITALRLSARAAAPRLELPYGSSGGRHAQARETRRAYFPETNGYVDTPCYRRDDLDVGAKIIGPAIVEDGESTSVLLPGDRARVDAYHNLIVEIGA